MSAATGRAATPGAAPPGRLLFVLAAVCGLLHAVPSLYWAAGGSWLLETVGRFAVDMRASGDPTVPVLLGAVALAKAAGAVVPLVDHLRPPMHRGIRAVSWLGAAVLVLWGGAGTVGAWIGVLTGAAEWSSPAVLGHALLWDPLFLLWGGSLAGALWRSRAERAPRAQHPTGGTGRGTRVVP